MSNPEPIYFDSHMHTPLCKHAIGHPREYMLQGVSKNLKGIIMTCHSPMPDRFSHRVRMDPIEFPRYMEIVNEAAEESPEGFDVLLGMESDYFPGMESWLTELHSSADFHYILGSVHWHIPEYVDAFWRGDHHDFRAQYFDHLAESAESGLFDCLSHPDLVKNASPEDWHFETIQPEIESALDRIAATGVAMELNTSGLNKSMSEMNPGPQMLALMHARGIPVVIGSDSHTPNRVGESFLAGLVMLEQIGYEHVSVFRERKRRDLKISEVKDSITP